jgi:hypothetical protein
MIAKSAHFYTHRYAERGVRGGRPPRVAAALPALPEATLLTPLCGALAATRQFETMGGLYHEVSNGPLKIYRHAISSIQKY